jgi:PPK2 family polyphosphate:nucleotide phosphotransferase
MMGPASPPDPGGWQIHAGKGTMKNILKRAKAYASAFQVTNGKGFRLRDFDPGDTLDLNTDKKDEASEALRQGVEEISRLQEMLYAQDRWAVLLIFQAMDAAGKDGTIKHVLSGVNPQGCDVHAFKAPSSEELDHDFLWRCMRHVPERGRLGIFNRSYYEETLVVRVHRDLLDKQKLPEELVTKHIWKERFEDIRHYERYLCRNGVIVRKFFLHLSKKEQRRRFLERLENPEKHWKFSSADAREREHWDAYMDAYEDTIRHTATSEAPWYVVPADNKWFTRLVVSSVVIDTLSSLKLSFPEVDPGRKRELEAARSALAKNDHR